MYTKEEAFKRINELQDRYEIELINLIKNENNVLKEINFSSPIGTGKTNMIAGVINKLSDNEYFFIITTLSKGQLDKQIRRKIEVLSYAFLANNFFYKQIHKVAVYDVAGEKIIIIFLTEDKVQKYDLTSGEMILLKEV